MTLSNTDSNTNPYNPVLPTRDPAHFYGQEAAFAFIRQQAFAEKRPRSPFLIGRAGIGKTSILWQVPHRLDARTIAVYIDLEHIDFNVVGQLWFAMIETSRVALDAAGVSTYRLPDIPLDLPPEELLNWFVSSYLEVALTAMRQARRLLFLFDNGSAILNAAEHIAGSSNLLDQMAELLMHDDRIKSLFAFDLADGERAEHYPLFSDPLLVYHVPFLVDFEADALIREPAVFAYGLHSEAARAIRTLAGGFPYALHAINQLIFDRSASRNHDRPIELEDVLQILPQAISGMTPIFGPEWSRATLNERQVLASLSRLTESNAGRSITREALYAYLVRETANVPDETSLIVSLRRLEYQDMIRVYPDRGYSFAVGLHQQWLLLNGQISAEPALPVASVTPTQRRTSLPIALIGALVTLIAIVILLTRPSLAANPDTSGAIVASLAVPVTAGAPTETLDVNLEGTRRVLSAAQTSIAQTQTVKLQMSKTAAMLLILVQTPTRPLTSTATLSLTSTQTLTNTTSPTSTPTASATGTASLVPTASASITETTSATPSATDRTKPLTVHSATPTRTPTLTPTLTRTLTPTYTYTWTLTPSLTPSDTLTVTPSLTETPTVTATETASATQTPTLTLTPSPAPQITIQIFPTHMLPTGNP